jgi:hypothetical protein
MDADTLTKQLEELHLIRCSLLPGELLTFIGGDSEAWTELLDNHASATPTSNQFQSTLSPAHLQLKVEAANVWLEVRMPSQYMGDLRDSRPSFSVKGENISRSEQESWGRIIAEKSSEIAETECVDWAL